jgi:hypothetical protein
MITKNRLFLFIPALVLLGILLLSMAMSLTAPALAAYPTATRTRTATAGPSLTRTRTATTGPSLTLTPTITSTSEPYYVNIALVSNFPQIYIGGVDMMVTVSTNITNATFALIVIDTATGLEQSQTSPILSPAHPAPQTANLTLGNLANFSLNGVRPGIVFFRATVTGEMCTPVCAQGSITKDSANVSVVSGPTPTRTPTPTVTPTQPIGPCSPINATIASPFTFDGAGTFCWQVSAIDNWINSFNTASVTVNGTNFTNLFAVPASLPAKINGFWYVKFISNVPWAHFEIK